MIAATFGRIRPILATLLTCPAWRRLAFGELAGPMLTRPGDGTGNRGRPVS